MLLIVAILLDYRFNAEAEGLSYTVSEVLAWSLLLYQLFARGPEAFLSQTLAPAFRRNPGASLWMLWAAAASLASAFLLNRWEALNYAKQMIPGFIAFLLIVQLSRSRSDWVWMERSLILGLLALGLLGSSQYFFGGPYPVRIVEITFVKFNLEGNFVRDIVTGLSPHPNNFGMIVAPALAFCMVSVLHKPLKFPSPLVMAAVLAGSIALYGTAMKGAYFWLALGVVLALLPRRLLSAAGVVGAMVLCGYGLIEYSLALDKDIASTMYGRTQLWQTALDHLSRPMNWLTGADIADVAYDNLKRMAWEFPSSHMVYLNNALYFGWPAAALFIAAVWSGIGSAVKVAKGSHVYDTSARGVLAALVTVAGIGLLEGIADPSRFGILFISLGLAAAGHNIHNAATQRRLAADPH